MFNKDIYFYIISLKKAYKTFILMKWIIFINVNINFNLIYCVIFFDKFAHSFNFPSKHFYIFLFIILWIFIQYFSFSYRHYISYNYEKQDFSPILLKSRSYFQMHPSIIHNISLYTSFKYLNSFSLKDIFSDSILIIRSLTTSSTLSLLRNK